ncbi:MAG TPA: hypothetical protein PLZ51_15700, partial [Aggregatilineales bacterium]|nr:hypothetical protein [Aggregatilineales bacterium]
YFPNVTGMYQWRVRAIDRNHNMGGEWSETRTFNIVRLEGTNLIAPAHQSLSQFHPIARTVTFDWSDVAGATQYTIIIDT